MKKIKIGEYIKCDNGKEYVCFFEFENEGIAYLCLTTNTKPPEVKFAKYDPKTSNDTIAIIGNREEKQRVCAMFKRYIGQ